MQDNDSKHTSRRVKCWFMENRIVVMDWPAQSPDLNLIENLWTDAKEAVCNKKIKDQQEFGMLSRMLGKIFLYNVFKI